MKRFSGGGAGDRAIGADEAKIEAQFASDGHGKGMAASGDQHDFDAEGVGVPQRVEVGIGDFKARIQQRAVNVGGDQADGLHSIVYIARRGVLLGRLRRRNLDLNDLGRV